MQNIWMPTPCESDEKKKELQLDNIMLMIESYVPDAIPEVKEAIRESLRSADCSRAELGLAFLYTYLYPDFMCIIMQANALESKLATTRVTVVGLKSSERSLMIIARMATTMPLMVSGPSRRRGVRAPKQAILVSSRSRAAPRD